MVNAAAMEPRLTRSSVQEGWQLKAAAMTADTMMPTEGAPFLLVFANALGRAPSSAMACIVSAFRF